MFISSTFHTSYRHRGSHSVVFTELNMEHMRISRVGVWCVVHLTVHHLSSDVCTTPCLCVCVCALLLRTSGLLVLMRGEGRQ